MILKLFKSGIFSLPTTPLSTTESKCFRISIPKVFQRLPIALAQVKAGKSLGNILNETCHVIISL